MPTVKTLSRCAAIFKTKYGNATVQLSAPGRANIIGEHTDYNQGFVLPFAIDKYIHFVAAPAQQEVSRCFAANLEIATTIDTTTKYDGYAKFLQACLVQVEKKYGRSCMVDLVFGGDLPIGAGMSSSSALCCGFLAVLSRLFNLELSGDDLLQMAIAVERGVAVEGGIMDQYSIINGKAGHAILLDCLDNSVEQIAFDLGGYCFCLIDSGVSHNLQETAYDQRVKTCQAALVNIKKANPAVKNFRDIEKSDLVNLPALQKNRMQHVLEENERVRQAVKYLKGQELLALGQILNESHASLRDLFEVSCGELDLIVELLQGEEAVAGARMMGGGFGGSTIALLKRNALPEIMEKTAAAYFKAFEINLQYYQVAASNGLLERISNSEI